VATGGGPCHGRPIGGGRRHHRRGRRHHRGDTHAGPHAGVHLLYLREERALFTGDTVLGLGTVAIVPPPHGDMGLYLQSLERLKGYDAALLLPGHGPPVEDVGRKLQELVDHRHQRERQILAAVGRGRGTLRALLDDIYPELDRRLLNMAAARSWPTWRSWRARAGGAAGEGDGAVWGVVSGAHPERVEGLSGPPPQLSPRAKRMVWGTASLR